MINYIINNQEIIVKNSYELINNDNEDEYYKIGIKKGISFKIDKKNLLDILVYISSDNIYTVMEWNYNVSNKRFINSTFVNSNGNSDIINIINYLKKDYTNLGNKKINVVFLNDDYYDFRVKNIKEIPIIGKDTTKVKLIDTKPDYFIADATNQITILQEFSGHQKRIGSGAFKERNKYKLVEITKNRSSKYYKILWLF